MNSPLARALQAVRDAKPAAALEALLAAWAKAPSRPIAELVEQASGIARTSAPELRGRTKKQIEAWMARGRAPKPEDVPALLEALTDVLWRDANTRISLVARWRPDPRVDEALVRLLETLPYRSTSKPFYLAVITLATRIRDEALIQRIKRARDAIGQLMSPTLGEWLERRVDELLEEIGPKIATPAAPVAAVEQLREELERLAKSKAPRASLAELLDAIHERPDDLERRRVYADALCEQGDPRGELINLQCQAELTPAQQRRVKALLKEHGRAWLGELSAVLSIGWRFERGFLAEARVDSSKGSRIRPLVGHPAWSTVHTLADSAQIALHPVMRALRTLEFRPNRARKHEGLDDAWRELLAGTQRPIERLRYTDLDHWEDDEWQLELLGECSALPSLRQLYVGGQACWHAARLLAAPVCSRLDTLGFMLGGDVPSDLSGSALRDSPVKRVAVVHPEISVVIERGAGGLERARVQIHERGPTAIAVLSDLQTSHPSLELRI